MSKCPLVRKALSASLVYRHSAAHAPFGCGVTVGQFDRLAPDIPNFFLHEPLGSRSFSGGKLSNVGSASLRPPHTMSIDRETRTTTGPGRPGLCSEQGPAVEYPSGGTRQWSSPCVRGWPSPGEVRRESREWVSRQRGAGRIPTCSPRPNGRSQTGPPTHLACQSKGPDRPPACLAERCLHHERRSRRSLRNRSGGESRRSQKCPPGLPWAWSSRLRLWPPCGWPQRLPHPSRLSEWC